MGPQSGQLLDIQKPFGDHIYNYKVDRVIAPAANHPSNDDKLPLGWSWLANRQLLQVDQFDFFYSMTATIYWQIFVFSLRRDRHDYATWVYMHTFTGRQRRQPQWARGAAAANGTGQPRCIGELHY